MGSSEEDLTAPGAPRDNGPASDADGVDGAGPVVFVGRTLVQTAPPAETVERLMEAIRRLAGIREGLVQVGEAARQASLNIRARKWTDG